MRIVLSRKGFDTKNGGTPSAIMPNGDMVSFPIPSEEAHDFSELQYDGVSYDKVLRDLLPHVSFPHCHVDPDLDQSRWKKPPRAWKPAFGQAGPSATYLTKTVGLKRDDLLLFFGWYHRVARDASGKFSYVSRTGNFYDDRDLHVIWGYMQVGEIIAADARIAREYPWHPHASFATAPTNILVIPRARLSFAPSKPGHGLLPFSRQRVLTAEGKSKAYWRWNPVYAPGNVIVGQARKNSSRDPKCIYYSGIWQELGLKESAAAAEWAKRVILDE